MGKRKGFAVLLIFSLALNCAFVGAWVYHYFYVRPTFPPETVQRAEAEAEAERPVGAGWRRLEALNLTDEQRRKLTAEHIALRQQISEARRRSRAACEKLLDLLAAPESDPEALIAVQEEISVEEAEMQRLVVKQLVRMRDTLGHEQMLKLRRMLRPMHPPYRRSMRRHNPGRPEEVRPHEGHESPEPPEMQEHPL